MKKILLVIGFVFFGLGGIQVIHAQDKMRLDNLDRAYMFIPDSLSAEDYLKRFEAAEKQTNDFISGLAGDEKKWATLIRYKGILWGLGGYIHENKATALKEMLEQKLDGLDLDSQDVELLPDNEIMNLINGYLNYYYPEMPELQRATYVLYNIKSEKVRNIYVMQALVSALKTWGCTREVEDLITDIDLCSKTEATKAKAHELKNWYYPVRAGEMAPDFEAEDEFGKSVKLSDYRGKVVFIDVWATWCGGCVEGLPYFVALREQYKDREDIVFLTVTYDGEGAKEYWKKFLQEKKFSGVIPHLFPKNKKQFDEDYCVTGIPRYILIDKEGKIVNAWHVAAKHEFFPFVFDSELKMMAQD